ncbi:MAG: cell division cycle 123 family protein [Candidatus Pacebacteria bacterium]|nr:cell division cycle 123 family protein [Candidatus Paceibacterota bacterium]
MIPISEWYKDLGQFSFPTVFVALRPVEVKALLAGDCDGDDAKQAIGRVQQGIHDLPGSAFVSADVCAPTDSEKFGKRASVSYGRVAWRLLAASAKVCEAFRNKLTERIVIRPFRRMNRTREFRLFFRGRKLLGMSQYNLERHFGRLAKREKELWRRGQKCAETFKDFLPYSDVVVDIYLTSDDRVLIVDLNPWGPPTDPLLFRTWERDWESKPGIKLIPRPMKMKGEISVSF